MKPTFLIILRYILSIQLLKLFMVHLIMLQMATEEGKVPVREYFVEKAPRKAQCEEFNKVLSLGSSKVILQHFIYCYFLCSRSSGILSAFHALLQTPLVILAFKNWSTSDSKYNSTLLII